MSRSRHRAQVPRVPKDFKQADVQKVVTVIEERLELIEGDPSSIADHTLTTDLPVKEDQVAIYDVSTEDTVSMTLATMLGVVNDLTAEPNGPAVGDKLLLFDISQGASGTANSITYQLFMDGIGNLTSEASVAVGDSLPLFDTSATATDRVTIPNLFKAITILDAETAVDDDDIILVSDTSDSGAANRATVAELFKSISTLPAETAVDTADLVLLHDVSGTPAANYATVNELFKGFSTFASEASVDHADSVPLYDTSAGTADRSTVRNLFASVSTLPAETSVQDDDLLLLYDTSATAADHTTVANLFAAVNDLTADTAPVAGDYTLTYDTSATAAKKVDIKLIGAGRETLWVGAGEILSGTALFATVGPTSEFASYAFATDVNEIAYYHAPLPKKWANGSVSAKFYWTTTSANTGPVVWQLSADGLTDGSSTTVSYNSANVTDTPSGASKIYISDETSSVAMTTSSADECLLLLRFRRLGTNASDTHTGTAYLLGVQVYWTSDQNNDA